MSEPLSQSGMSGAGSPALSRGAGYNPWITSAVLATIYMASYLDRSVLAFLVEPIKTSLEISDVQVSLLLGVSFSLFYSAMTIPAGALVDRVDRRRLIVITGVCWSLASIACGLATSFGQLLAARMALGCAEAFISPAAFALLRDRIPPEQRGRSFSIMGMATYTGGAMSLILGGALLRAAMAGKFAGLPLVGALEPWQIVVVAIGVFAFVPVLLLVFIAPDRQRRTPTKGQGGFANAFAHMHTHLPAYATIIGYVTAASMLAFGLNSWMATMMARTFGIPLPQIGLTFGPVALASGLSGLLACGFILDRIAKGSRRYTTFAVVALLIATLAATATALAPSPSAAWGFYALSSFFTGAAYPIGASTLARITPSPLMGKITSVYLMFQSVIGSSAATIVALLAERGFAGPSALAYALASFCLAIGLVGTVFATFLDRTTGALNEPDSR